MAEWIDVALIFDAETRRTDVALGDDGDLVLDETPATPMLISLGSDRRAAADDTLPTGITELNAPSSWVERRGWAGDALDAGGRRIGVKLWLLDRAKQTEVVRLAAETWTGEAFAWVAEETGQAAEISATWVRRGLLAIRVAVDGRAITINRRAG